MLDAERLRPPEEWDKPKRPAPEPEEVSEDEVREQFEEIAEGRSGTRSITEKYVKRQTEAANRHVSLGHESSMASVPDQYQVSDLKYGPDMPPGVREDLDQYGATAYSHWIRQAKKTKEYNARDLKEDAVDHADEFGLKSGDENALRKQALSIIRNATAYRAKRYSGKVQLEFWTDRDYVVVDRSLKIRGCYHTPVPRAATNIKRKRLWLKTNAQS